MSTHENPNPNATDDHGSDNTGHGDEAAPKKRGFKKWFLAAALVLLAAAATWYWWGDSEPVTAPTPVAKVPTTPKVVVPAPTPAPLPPVVAAPVPSPIDEVAMPVTYEVIAGVNNRCVTTLVNGQVSQKDCFPIE